MTWTRIRPVCNIHLLIYWFPTRLNSYLFCFVIFYWLQIIIWVTNWTDSLSSKFALSYNTNSTRQYSWPKKCSEEIWGNRKATTTSSDLSRTKPRCCESGGVISTSSRAEHHTMVSCILHFISNIIVRLPYNNYLHGTESFLSSWQCPESFLLLQSILKYWNINIFISVWNESFYFTVVTVLEAITKNVQMYRKQSNSSPHVLMLITILTDYTNI